MKYRNHPELSISSLDEFLEMQNDGQSLKNCILRGVNFSALEVDWEQWEIDHTTFLGCELRLEDEIVLRRKGAYIYRAPDSLPYDPFRRSLYTWPELMKGFSAEADRSHDLVIYEHFFRTRYNPSVNEALWQRLHDHAIDVALADLLDITPPGMSRLRCVGIMGGHGVPRDDPFFEKAAVTARLLTRHGYFVATGGGPGIMEAANFGAYFGNYPEKDFWQALDSLRQAPLFTDPAYFRQALKVLEAYPQGESSLAVPTWFYGHEPSNLFASHIAKYFSNSIREDTLLAVCLHGIVFAPGSAGTTQEIFMDATQNHYGTFNFFSPMVFLGRHRYEIETLIFPLLRQLAWGREYQNLLFLTDEPAEILKFLQHHPPRPVAR